MVTIGLYIGTVSDGTHQMFEKQPWEEYLSEHNVETFGSASLPTSVADYYNSIATPSRYPKNLLEKLLATYWDCCDYLDSSDPDLLLQLMRYPTHAPGVSLAGYLNNIPVISRYMGDNFNEFRSSNGLRQIGEFILGNVIGKIPLHFSDKMIAFGPYSERLLVNRGMASKDIIRIPPKIRPSMKFDEKHSKSKNRNRVGLPQNKKIVLYSGRLTHKKGMGFLMQSIGKIKDDNTIFVLLGEGECENAIRERFNSELVWLPGKIPHELIHRYYKAADVYVHPSPYEGIPLSVLEALECGVPVIARPAGDIPFVVPNTVKTPEKMASVIRNESWENGWENRHEFDIHKHKARINNAIEDTLTNE